MATPTDPVGSARVEIRVTATIQRGVTLRDAEVAADIAAPEKRSRVSKDCNPQGLEKQDCRVIVVDLP